ncbi:MAG: glycosyltransferase [Bacteroidota bacterium]
MIEIILYFLILGLGGIVLIVYILYPLFISRLSFVVPKEPHVFAEDTVIYHLVPLYNEESVIREKIENCLSLQAPHKLMTVVVIDESSDKTSQIAKEFAEKFPEQLVVIDKGYRKGKNDSLNVAIKKMKPAENDILFFSDSNTMFETNGFEYLYQEMQKGYGLVGGAMSYFDETTGTAKSEGLYWRYEEWIRQSEAKIGKCIVVNGGNFAMLARYIKELPTYVPNDLEAPLRLCGAGVPVGFTKESKGFEKAVENADEELSRKKRMANRQMNCIRYLWEGLNFDTKVRITIRKTFRWMGVHIFFTVFFLALLGVVLFSSIFFWLAFFATGAVVSVIVIGLLLHKIGVHNKITSAIYHAVMVHVNSFKGMMSSVFGEKVSTWDAAKSNRS